VPAGCRARVDDFARWTIPLPLSRVESMKTRRVLHGRRRRRRFSACRESRPGGDLPLLPLAANRTAMVGAILAGSP